MLGQDLIKYRSLFPHVSAAIQLSNKDRHPSKGDTIKYIYTDSQHSNPLCRVASIDSINEKKEKLGYDKEKYKDILALTELYMEIEKYVKAKMVVDGRT